MEFSALVRDAAYGVVANLLTKQLFRIHSVSAVFFFCSFEVWDYWFVPVIGVLFVFFLLSRIHLYAAYKMQFFLILIGSWFVPTLA